MGKKTDLGRRRFLMTGAGLIAASALPARTLAQQKQLVIADPGGPYTPAYRKAFYDPFEKETGVRVVNVVREAQPVAQLSAIVQTKNYIWDVTTLTNSADVPILRSRGALEPLGLVAGDFPGLMPDAVQADWLGVDVYSTILAYRTDKFPQKAPSSWADFWNVQAFPGRRALRRNALETIEEALMADGVAPDKLYPLDLDRAFRSLDRIKKHVAVWWTSGAQATQLLHSGEVDLISTWNGRAQAAIDSGAPVAIVWNQGMYSIEGWGVPRGSPRADVARQFVRFCAEARRQADFTEALAYGPTNLKAYEYIPQKRAALLPTAPQNIKNMFLPSPEWWHQNRDKVSERFNAWLLS